MAESSGSGMVGVLVGALLVLVIGGGLFFLTGKMGNAGGGSTVKIEVPKTK